MTKRLVDIDDDLLERVAEILGTTTMKAAVNGALQEVVNLALRRRHIQALEKMRGLDLNNPEVMAKAWR